MSEPRVQGHHEFYIVNEKNERIATATIHFKKGGLWLTDVWTAPEHRKQGLARKIIDHVLRAYVGRTIYLTIGPYTNAPLDEDQLGTFYQSFGFQRTDVPDVMVRP